MHPFLRTWTLETLIPRVVCVFSVCSNTHPSPPLADLDDTDLWANPSSQSARPRLTKDNPIDLPRRRVYSPPDNGCTTKPPPAQFFCFLLLFFFFFNILPPLMWSICSAVVWAWTCVDVPFLYKGKKRKRRRFTSWIDGYCFFSFFLSATTRANKSKQCSLWADLSIM